MTDIRKLAAKHARGIEGHESRPEIKAAIQRALAEYKRSAVIDVTKDNPTVELVADRIARARPMPPAVAYSTGALIHRQITYRDILAYAVEMGRELERKSRAEVELEYGWQWASSPDDGTASLVYGSDTKESAERAMADTEKRVAPVRIMVREKAVAGPWREA